jgi:short-subunit dehydrogenase
MKTAVIIGASSGVGRELAKLLGLHDFTVGLVARRLELLNELQSEIAGRSYVRQIDVAKPDEAIPRLRALIADMGGVDLFVISAGTGVLNPELDWQREKQTIDVNVAGFAAMANVAAEHLQARGTGHIVALSSVAALRGNADAPAYNASKAFVSNYLEGLRVRFQKLGLSVAVTDAKLGFVDTAMAQGEGLFWVASPETAARQICAAICKRKAHVYVTRRWRVIAWVLKAMPQWLYARM